MTQSEYETISSDISQTIDDIAGNPEWYEAAKAVASDLGALEKKLEDMVVKGHRLWAAKDANAHIVWLFRDKPFDKGGWFYSRHPSLAVAIEERFIPFVTYENSPVEVEFCVRNLNK